MFLESEVNLTKHAIYFIITTLRGGNMKFIDAYNGYLNYIENRQKIQSKNSFKQRFEYIVLPYFGNMNIYEIEKTDYINFQNKLIEKGYSYNYIKNTHYYIVAFLNYCKTFYDLKDNVAKEIGMPKIKKNSNKENFYTLKEFDRFIKCVDHKIYKLFFTFMFYMGTRPGEAMALRFSDLIGNNIYIKKTIDEHHHNGIRTITTPKTESSVRTIKVPFLLLIELKQLKKYYIQKYGEIQDFYIFGGKKPLAPTSINRYKLNACKKAGVKNITLHGFRHSHATMLLDHNLSIKAIQERLGHSSADVTTSIYLHSTEKQQKRVLHKLNFVSLFSTF